MVFLKTIGDVDRSTAHKQARTRSHYGLRARIALDSQTRRDAFQLRHLCYYDKGHIDSTSNGEFSDGYDSDPENATIVVYDNDRAVASVRVCSIDRRTAGADERNLPLAQVFPEEFANLMQPNGRAVEINRLVRHPAYPSLGMVFILFRLAGFIIQRKDPDFVASCVRPNHVSFYKKLRFEHIAGPKAYLGVKFMSHFLACPRDSFEKVSESMPSLSFSPAGKSAYADLLTGKSVPITRGV